MEAQNNTNPVKIIKIAAVLLLLLLSIALIPEGSIRKTSTFIYPSYRNSLNRAPIQVPLQGPLQYSSFSSFSIIGNCGASSCLNIDISQWSPQYISDMLGSNVCIGNILGISTFSNNNTIGYFLGGKDYDSLLLNILHSLDTTDIYCNTQADTLTNADSDYPDSYRDACADYQEGIDFNNSVSPPFYNTLPSICYFFDK